MAWFGNWECEGTASPVVIPPYTCGTGDWGGPAAGDPDNFITLSATPAFGGIDLSWTRPALNPHAVSYTMIYRSTSSDPATAALLSTAGGTYYYDKVNGDILYFYWISTVSVHGTIMDWVGPASATARPLISEIIERLEGQLGESSLGLALKEEIQSITLNHQELLDEIALRVANNAALSAALADLDSGLIDALAFINNEITQRTSGDNALLTQINTILAANATNAAAILSEQTARVTADSAMALDITALYAATAGGGSAAARDMVLAKVGYSAKASDGNTPYDGNGSTLIYPVATYPSIDFPEYSLNRYRVIDSLGVDLWNATPAGISLPLVWHSGLPLAQAVKTVGVTDASGASATLEQAFTTQKTLNDGLKGQYTVKLDVNGRVSGFGIYGDSVGSSAIFNVDKFAIGTPGAVNNYPFILDGGVVYMKEAMIKMLSADRINTNGMIVRKADGSPLISLSGDWQGNTTGTLAGTAVATVVSNASTALSTANTANSTANAASTAVASKLSATAINTLGSGGAIKIGSINWDPYVWNFSGSGIAISEYGIVGMNSGNPTFVINYLGNAIFYGELSAAYGTFGALTVAAGGNIKSGKTTYADTTAGFWLGLDGGVPKFHVGHATAYMRWTGSALEILNGSLASPILSGGMTATVSSTSDNGNTNGTMATGSASVSVSNGRAPYTYQWAIASLDSYGGPTGITYSNLTSATMSISAVGTNSYLEHDVACIVTDANGLTMTKTAFISLQWGTQP